MKRREIDDAMINRALAGLNRLTFGEDFTQVSRARLRNALEAALNPPRPEPEIPISLAMRSAGVNSVSEYPDVVRVNSSAVAVIYTAMERVRLSEAVKRVTEHTGLYGQASTERPEYVKEQFAMRAALDAECGAKIMRCPECGVASYIGDGRHLITCSRVPRV